MGKKAKSTMDPADRKQRHISAKMQPLPEHSDADGFSYAGMVEEEICESIYSAILDQRLLPGTKLTEAALCEAFNTGRQRIRRVLLVLSSREVIHLHANRGAFVAEPSAEEAHAIFEARSTIEPTIIRKVCRYSTKDDINRLSLLVKAEQRERANGNRHKAIQLSGDFHILLASMARNQVFERILKQLVARTSLIIGLYGKRDHIHCAEDEHESLVTAITKRDEDTASELMLNHLRHIENEIDLKRRSKAEVDLNKIFRG